MIACNPDKFPRVSGTVNSDQHHHAQERLEWIDAGVCRSQRRWVESRVRGEFKGLKDDDCMMYADGELVFLLSRGFQ